MNRFPPSLPRTGSQLAATRPAPSVELASAGEQLAATKRTLENGLFSCRDSPSANRGRKRGYWAAREVAASCLLRRDKPGAEAYHSYWIDPLELSSEFF